MMTALRRLFIAVFVVLCSTRLMDFWETYPNSFPAPLRWLGLRLIDLFEPPTPEDVADIEEHFVLLVSLFTVSVITWLALLVIKRFR